MKIILNAYQHQPRQVSEILSVYNEANNFRDICCILYIINKNIRNSKVKKPKIKQEVGQGHKFQKLL